MPKVSVIMPVYNGEKYLDKSLGSLINQTFRDIEIICINDCSTDLSLQILQDYAKNDERIKIINNDKNLGQSISRNIGIKQSKSDYIMFIDQDDWYELNTCELVLRQIEQNKNDFLIFNIKYHNMDSGDVYVDDYRLEPFKEVMNCPNIQPHKLHTNIFRSSYVWCQIFNKNFILDNNIEFSIEKNADDIPFFCKALAYANSISIINEPLYNYRIYNEQTTSSRTDLWKTYFTAREKAYNSVISSPHAKQIIDAFLVYYISSLMYWYKYATEKTKYIKKDFYNELRKVFIYLDNKHDISQIKEHIDYKKFNRIINESWGKKRFKEFTRYIFFLGNSHDKSHKLITVFGLKFKVKKGIHFPISARTYKKVFNKPVSIKSAAVFATFDKKGLIPDNTVEYLKEIKRHIDYVIVVSDNPIKKSEVNKISNIADAVLFQRHGEYDFGSYKRGYLKLKKLGVLDKIDKLLFFNDSVIWENKSLSDLFCKAKSYKFFGVIPNKKGTYFKGKYYSNFHIQSWFLIVSKEIFNSKWFMEFISSIKKEKYKREIIIKYEMGLSKLITEHGYEINAYYPITEDYDNPDKAYAHPDNDFGGRLFIKKRFLGK